MMFFRVLAALSLLTMLACERPVPPSMRDKVNSDGSVKATEKPVPTKNEKAPEAKPVEAKPVETAEAPADEAPADEAAVDEAPADEAPADAVAISDAARAEAQTKYTTVCLACHGAAGDGAGPVGAALTPKPRDFTDAKWLGETSDELIAKAILKGGMAIGKSPLMPGNPDLESKPDVVAALVEMIRGFKK